MKFHKIIGFIFVFIGFWIKDSMALPMMSFPVAIPIITGMVIMGYKKTHN